MTMTMRFLVAATLTLASMVTRASALNDTETTCPMLCQNEAPCLEGANTYEGHPTKSNGSPLDFLVETNREDHYCDCPDNFTGIRCGRAFVECEGTGHYCYHGGTCIQSLSGDAIPDDELFCDCSDASHDDISYVGKYCEQQGAQACDQDGEFFCLNGATCKDDFETKQRPCECLDGYRGLHCEFETDSVPECDLRCENSGLCELGIKDYETALYTEFWATDEGYMHCTCADGFFGNQCEVGGEKCGPAHCFNGAACLETISMADVTTYSCDCLTAANTESSFAGDYCQSESTSFCTKTVNQNGHLFCTNGGTCGLEGHTGCECPPGFHGPICEFRDSELATNCTLSCSNEGKCRTGSKDMSLIDQFGSELDDFNQTHTENWEHCVCPDGFFGVQCEHELEICPGGNHVCLHGSSCVEQSGTTELSHECDCDGGFDSVEKYAGKYCQYTSTDICTKNGHPGVGKANFAFCVNSGKCKARVDDTEPHPGCICPEGFAGDHCEFLEGNVPDTSGSATDTDNQSSNAANNSSIESGNHNSGLIIGICVVLVAILATGAIALVVIREQKQGKEDIIVETNISPTAETEPSAPFSHDSDVQETITDFPGIKEDKTMQTVEIV